MNDELSRLQRQMEEATAADCGPDCPHDTETASLRQGWLAFGELLEAAQPMADEPLQLRPMPRRTARSRRLAAGIAAVAASVVVAVTLAWSLLGPKQPADPSTPAGGAVASGAAQTDELDWDDSLDQQIVQAGQQMVRIQQDWYRPDDAFGSVHDGLEQMEKDIDDNLL